MKKMARKQGEKSEQERTDQREQRAARARSMRTRAAHMRSKLRWQRVLRDCAECAVFSMDTYGAQSIDTRGEKPEQGRAYERAQHAIARSTHAQQTEVAQRVVAVARSALYSAWRNGAQSISLSLSLMGLGRA